MTTELRPFSDSLPMLLLRAREASLTYFREVLSRYGLTEQQWRVLRVLNEEEALSASLVATRTALLPPSLSRIVKGLAERQLVRNQRASHDARELRLTLTPAGRKLVAEIAPLSEAQYARMEERLSQAQLKELHRLLRKFIGSQAPGCLT